MDLGYILKANQMLEEEKSAHELCKEKEKRDIL